MDSFIFIRIGLYVCKDIFTDGLTVDARVKFNDSLDTEQVISEACLSRQSLPVSGTSTDYHIANNRNKMHTKINTRNDSQLSEKNPLNLNKVQILHQLLPSEKDIHYNLWQQSHCLYFSLRRQQFDQEEFSA